MKVLHVARLHRDGVEWHIELREISRQLSPTGLAFVFSTAVGPRAGSPVLWPVTTEVIEDLLESIEGKSDRLAQELDAALRWHGTPHDGAFSARELGARTTGPTRARESSR